MARRMSEIGSMPPWQQQELREVSRQWNHDLSSAFELFDLNKSGFLSAVEMSQVMKKLQNDMEPSSLEIDWIMNICGNAPPGGQLSIDRSRFLIALQAWTGYVLEKPVLLNILLEYDIDKKNGLSEEDLKCLLTRINAEVAPPDKVVKWVMERAALTSNDNILRSTDLLRAIALWYTYDEAAADNKTALCTLL
eukprot:GHVL01023833.1.p2 GENE.GHVL01023833.1~~GHVL01023833.1.p2  ORF type:complete len:193 (+),score=40.08 GHVL01023833.1:26-604(+)